MTEEQMETIELMENEDHELFTVSYLESVRALLIPFWWKRTTVIQVPYAQAVRLILEKGATVTSARGETFTHVINGRLCGVDRFNHRCSLLPGGRLVYSE